MSIKQYYERYAINCLGMIVDKRYLLLAHNGDNSPDWISTDDFSCGVEVTQGLNDHKGEFYSFVRKHFCKNKSIEEIQKADGKGNYYLKDNIAAEYKGLGNTKNGIIYAEDAIIKKLKKLNNDYMLFDSNELFITVYISCCDIRDIKNIINRIEFSQYKIIYNIIFFFDNSNLYIYNNDLGKLEIIGISIEMLKEIKKKSLPYF